MDAFTTHTGIGVPLRRSNVDTDQIIPAVYLKRVTRNGFEDGLFAAWRKDETSSSTTRRMPRGSVLVAGPDFGTGSSREHAVWALMDYGFRVVISSRFADIFRGNSGKQGLLTASVAQDDVELLWKYLENEPGRRGHRGPRRRGPSPPASIVAALRGRRLHPVAAAGGPGRHRPHAAARGRHHRFEADPARPTSPGRHSLRPMLAPRARLVDTPVDTPVRRVAPGCSARCGPRGSGCSAAPCRGRLCPRRTPRSDLSEPLVAATDVAANLHDRPRPATRSSWGGCPSRSDGSQGRVRGLIPLCHKGRGPRCWTLRC